MLGINLITNRKQLFLSLLYFAVLVLGVLLLINNKLMLTVCFYMVGGGIIVASFYLLLPFFRRGAMQHPMAIFKVFFIVLLLLSGATIIINATKEQYYYQSFLSSVFFFLAFHRFFYAYINKRTANKRNFVIYTIIAIYNAILAAFFTFYTYSEVASSIVAGIAVMLEGFYGLYQLWGAKLVCLFKNKYAFATPRKSSNTYAQNNEIVITDYEIVENGEDQNS